MKTLKLTGKIEEAMSYKITTYYKSDKKNSLCGERSFGLGFGDHKSWHLTYSYNKRTYLPTIKD